MRLYLDDNIASDLFADLLRKATHDVQLPMEIGFSGVRDPEHLTRAIADDRICVTKNYHDFWLLHKLIKQAKGHHPGIFVIRYDNDPTRDPTLKGIVAAIRKLEKAGAPIDGEYIILNHWR